MLGIGKRRTMDISIPERNPPRAEASNAVHGQRSSPQVNKDPNVPPTDLTHRTPIPLCSGTCGQESPPDNWDQGQGQPCRPINEALTDELDWAMEDGSLHWLDTVQWD